MCNVYVNGTEISQNTPFNFFNGKIFSGKNAAVISDFCLSKKFKTCAVCTYKQAERLGVKVKKGEHGVKVFAGGVNKEIMLVEGKPVLKNGEIQYVEHKTFKSHTYFNVEQLNADESFISRAQNGEILGEIEQNNDNNVIMLAPPKNEQKENVTTEQTVKRESKSLNDVFNDKNVFKFIKAAIELCIKGDKNSRDYLQGVNFQVDKDKHLIIFSSDGYKMIYYRTDYVLSDAERIKGTMNLPASLKKKLVENSYTFNEISKLLRPVTNADLSKIINGLERLATNDTLSINVNYLNCMCKFYKDMGVNVPDFTFNTLNCLIKSSELNTKLNGQVLGIVAKVVK